MSSPDDRGDQDYNSILAPVPYTTPHPSPSPRPTRDSEDDDDQGDDDPDDDDDDDGNPGMEGRNEWPLRRGLRGLMFESEVHGTVDVGSRGGATPRI